jgi:hypothetical protein
MAGQFNENGTDGFFTEAPLDGYTLISTIETFEQASGKIVKVVARQRSKHENHELVADAILASDVGLIDDQRAFVRQHIRRDIYDVMAPVSKNKLTGTWTRRVAGSRTGYVAGPQVNQLESFTY